MTAGREWSPEERRWARQALAVLPANNRQAAIRLASMGEPHPDRVVDEIVK